MLDVKYLRDHIDEVKERVGTRGTTIDWESFLKLDAARRELLQEVESLRCQRNEVSETIASMKKEKKDASQEIENMRSVSQRIKELDGILQDREAALNGLLLTIPNVPHASVAVGNSSADNPEIRRWGELPQFTFEPKAHWDIGEQLGILDFDRGAKITGARFTVYLGAGAQLERALINFMLDVHTREHHYLEVLPPFIVNRESMTATGQLPKFEEDLFKLDASDYYLIPTAEVPVTNIHQNEILPAGSLPRLLHRLHPLFSKRSRFLWERNEGADTTAPVQQGGTGEIYHPGALV